MRRKAWTATEDTYLIETYASLTASAQAAQLQRSASSVYQRRYDLQRAGRLPQKHRRWTADEDLEIVALAESGATLLQIMRQLGRTGLAIVRRLADLGTPLGVIRTQGILKTRSARQVAALLGTSSDIVRRWIRTGDLAAAKNGARMLYSRVRRNRIERQRYRRRRTGRPKRYSYQTAWFLVSDESLMVFLSERNNWMLVDPAKITDPEWRTFAEDARAQIEGEWWDAETLGRHIYLSASHLRKQFGQGVYPAVMRYGCWYVWSTDALDIARRRAA